MASYSPRSTLHEYSISSQSRQWIQYTHSVEKSFPVKSPPSFPPSSMILHALHALLWAVSQVNDEHDNLLFFPHLFATQQTEPSNRLLAHQFCENHNFYLAFRCGTLLRSKYSCLCVCSSRLPRRFRINALHIRSVQNSQLHYLPFDFFLIYDFSCSFWSAEIN